MRLPRNIRENLRFLLAESGSQLANLRRYFREPADSLAKRILDRGGYAYNLKQRIHESCLERIVRYRKTDDSDVASLRALESIASDLERLTELCRDCIQQLERVQDRSCLRTGDYRPMLGWMTRAIGRIEPAIRNSDTQLALKIGRVKPRLDHACRKLRKQYTAELKRNSKATDDLIAGLLVSHCIEQMSDTLLNISEAVISINLGHIVNSDRYHSLQTSMEHLGVDNANSNLVIETIAETRSGSAISGITTQPVLIKIGIEDAFPGGLTFKEGATAAVFLSKLGFDALEISQGLRGTNYGQTEFRTNIDSPAQEGYFRHWCREIKRLVDIPTLMIGGLRSFDLIEQVFENKETDFVALCRPLVREPNLIKRWQNGNRRPATCISCNLCLQSVRKGQPLHCGKTAESMK